MAQEGHRCEEYEALREVTHPLRTAPRGGGRNGILPYVAQPGV